MFIVILISIILFLYAYWRFFFFFRDPEREISGGDHNIVAPADGTIVYIKDIKSDDLLFSVKKSRKISLKEFSKNSDLSPPCFLIGIFMHPTSVHVNRAPISGRIDNICYVGGRNLPMTITWWRVLLRLKPASKFASYIVSNERNIISISGKLKVVIIQIADLYVNKIVCWIKEGDLITKGQRVGLIKMGSQVDTLIPKVKGLNIRVKEGQKVKAGETIIASLESKK